MIISFICFSIFAVLFFGKMNMMTKLHEKEGLLNDYSVNTLTPINRKQVLGLLDAMDSKEKREEFRVKVKTGKI